jgi:hypothetical protein
VSGASADADRVQLTVKGQLGPDLAGCFDDLDIELRPRHTVLVAGPDDVADLVPLLRALERRGILVDRIT